MFLLNIRSELIDVHPACFIKRHQQVDIQSATYTYIERQKIVTIVLYANALYKKKEIEFNVS